MNNFITKIGGLRSVIFIAAIIVAVVYSVYDSQRFKVSGTETSAIVSSLEDIPVKSGSSTRHEYYIRYQFLTNQQSYDGRSKISHEVYKTLSVGEKINILYMPKNPEKNKYVNATWSPFGIQSHSIFSIFR